jgi:hypothetical protein
MVIGPAPPASTPTPTLGFADEWSARIGGLMADSAALTQWTFIFTAVAAVAAVIAVLLMIRLRSELTYVSFPGRWDVVSWKGRVVVQGRIFVHPLGGGYLITGISARGGITALLPEWLGAWKWRPYEVSSERAGTSWFKINFPDPGFPFYLLAIGVQLVEGKKKICKRIVRIKASVTADVPSADTADLPPQSV